MVLTCLVGLSYGKLNPREMLNAIGQGSDQLKDTIVKQRNLNLEGLAATAKYHADRISTNFDSLTSSEKQLVYDARSTFNSVKNQAENVKNELVELSEITIKASNDIINRLRNINVDTDEDAARRLIGASAKTMTRLLKDSERKLGSSKKKYDSMLRQLANAKGKILSYYYKVRNLGDEENERFSSYISEKRAIVYGTTWLLGPFGIGAAAAILESHIASWRKEVDRISESADRAADRADAAYDSATNKINAINNGVKLVVRWRARIEELSEAFDSQQAFIDHVTWLDMKDDVKDKMKALNKACANYTCYAKGTRC